MFCYLIYFISLHNGASVNMFCQKKIKFDIFNKSAFANRIMMMIIITIIRKRRSMRRIRIITILRPGNTGLMASGG